MAQLRAEIELLRAQRDDAQETLRAIQDGTVDALVIDTPDGQRVFTLQGADQTYRHLIERMGEGAATLSADGIVHFCNHALADLLKQPLEQVIGTPILQHVAIPDQTAFQSLLCQGLADRAMGEVGLIASDGSTVPVKVGISLQSDGVAATSLSMIVFDLTERKRTEAVLASAQFMRRLIDNAPIGVAVVDRDLRYVVTNRAYQAIADMPVVGRTIREVFPPAVAAIVQPLIQRVLDSGEAAEFREFEAPIRGRTWWNVSEIPLRDDAGNTEAVLILTQEVTEQKLAGDSLRESEERFRIMADGLPLIIWVHDAKGQLQFANRTYCEFFGVSLDQVCGPNWQPLVHPDDATSYAGEFFNCVRDRRPFHGLARVRGADGQWRWIESWGRPRFSASGEYLGIVGTSPDVTERKRMEENLNEARMAAERASEAKSRFLANISHELRTPMNAILGLVDLALPKQTDATAKEFLQTTRESADLLLTLLNDLLDSSKIEAGKLELESSPFSLRRMLDQMMRVLAVRASEAGLAFSCRIPAELPDAVVGDQVRLRQVLLNLAGNAIKFTEQGEVELSVRAVSQDSEVVCLEFAVRDTGIGISPSEIEHLFQPFSQADASTTRRFGGTGLGLSICSSIVRMMSGNIWVESEPGKGSTFYFAVPFPLASEVPPEEETAPEVPAEAASTLRILLVEDNPANQTLAAYILRDRGHSVEIVGDGHQALRMTQDAVYDVILMDVQMPGMDGLEATKAIRARENGSRRVPIIAMTAHAMKGDRERCLEAGMDGYMSKPIDGHAMIALVESLAAGTAPSIESRNPPATDVFDPDTALRRCFNSEELVGQIIACFFADTRNLLPQMRTVLEKGDLVELGHLAHRLKGTLVHLGAASAREVAGRLEQFMLRPGEQAEAEEAVRALEHECEVLGAALTEYQATNKRPAGASCRIKDRA